MQIYTFDEHWQAVHQHYVHWVRVHDLGNGHKEVLVQRSDRFLPDPVKWPRIKSQAEKDAANAERAARRAKSEVRRRCKAMGLDCLLTLTYRANQQDEALCKQHMKEFVTRLRRVVPGFRYVAAFERQDRGAWHVHLAVQRLQSHFQQRGVRVKSFDLVRAIWRSVVGDLGGNIDMQRRQKSARKTVAQLAAYLSKYMTKAYEEGKEYSKRWTASRFALPEADRLLIRGKNIKQIIADLVAEHAPDGTVIRSCFVDGCKGFFFTVEPSGSGGPASGSG